MAHDAIVTNPWSTLRRFTPAHVGLGRAGVSLPTQTMLAFQLAHAKARDAVHEPLDVPRMRTAIEALGVQTLALASEAGDRATYLQRPDLGRQLAVASQRALDVLGLPYRADSFDVAFAVVDGLSSRAIHRHAAPFLREVLARLAVVGAGEPVGSTTWSVAPVAVVEQGRVAIGDVIGEALARPARRGADWRASRPQFARQPRRLSDVGAAPGPHRRRAQLPLEHPARGDAVRGCRRPPCRAPARRTGGGNCLACRSRTTRDLPPSAPPRRRSCWTLERVR